MLTEEQKETELLKPEPVAEVTDVFGLVWIGSGPIASVVRKHNIRVGDKLYATPPDSAARIKELEAEVERLRTCFLTECESIKASAMGIIDSRLCEITELKEKLRVAREVLQKSNVWFVSRINGSALGGTTSSMVDMTDQTLATIGGE